MLRNSAKIFLTFIPALIIIASFVIFLLFLKVYQLSRRGRRTPLTRELLRSPGESLRNQIEDLSIDFDSYLMMLFISPLIIYSSFLSQKESNTNISVLLLAIVSLVFFTFFIYKLWRLLKQRANLRLGLDCEMAVGQELNQLMLEGYRVYHDFPVEEFNKKFNIDHIVVSPKGVFAIETKGRAKFNKSLSNTEAKVIYDGQTLKFPNWTETKPLEQALQNANWLSKWLSSSVGEKVDVYPVVALPGWWVEREGTGDVYVFNPRNPQPFFRTKGNSSIPENLIDRIAHQLDQKCRDVEPTAYKKDKK